MFKYINKFHIHQYYLIIFHHDFSKALNMNAGYEGVHEHNNTLNNAILVFENASAVPIYDNCVIVYMGGCECAIHDEESENQTVFVKSQTKTQLKYMESSLVKTTQISSQSVLQISFPNLPPAIVKTRMAIKDFNLENSLIRGQHISKAFKLSNNIIYEGQWKDEMIHGRGRFYLPDKSYMQCISRENKPIGQCLIIKQNGDYYLGQLKEFMANGNGKYQNGTIYYEGQFYNNLPHGKGKEYGPQYMFEGQYQLGEKIMGKLMWNLTEDFPSSYEGSFRSEKFHGKGNLSTQKGNYQGQFKNNKKQGFGIFTYRNGCKYEGQYHNNKKHGEGRIFNPNGRLVLHGIWDNDKGPQQ